MDFGRGPLSHPLLVEAFEDLFVPVVIRNNVDGYEKQVLERYDEPTWNNPVMRFLDARGGDVLPRKDRVWSTHDVAARAAEALVAARRDVPGWLRVVEHETAELETATFAMHCFWVGEVKLGRLEGVVTTRAAWRGQLEVVELSYDPQRIDYEELVQAAQSLECASKVFAHTDEQLATARQLVGDRAARAAGLARPAEASDRHHELRRSPVRYVPLTPMQRTKANAAEDPSSVLSPRQREWLNRIESALEADPKALDGLEPAASFEALVGYVERLEARL